MTIAVDDETSSTVVRLLGELDMETAPQLVACVDEQLARGRTRLVVDLRALTFCDSRGLATLLTTAARCQAAGGSTHLTGAVGPVARVLSITGVAEFLASDTALDPEFGARPRQAPPSVAS